jgi:hypothetical protein
MWSWWGRLRDSDLLALSNPGSPGGVPDMKNCHPVIQHAVKNLVRISNERNDVDPGPIGDRLCRRRMLGNVCDNGANSRFNRGGYDVPKA